MRRQLDRLALCKLEVPPHLHQCFHWDCCHAWGDRVLLVVL